MPAADAARSSDIEPADFPNAASLPNLDVAYESDVDVRDEHVLAVLGFGRNAHLDDDRFLRVLLEPLSADESRCEVWRTRGRVAHQRSHDVRWSSDGDYAFVAIELEESTNGGVAGAAHAAYAKLVAWSASSDTPHLLRVWNYFDDINAGEGDDERYRQFCSGRAAGLGPAFAGNFPAASAIGADSGRRVVQVYALAARVPGTAVENPRQWSAWRYPRQYGPTAPGFARAMRAPTQFPQLYISGTAAVVGHASHHVGDIRAQLDETLRNLESLLQSAQSKTSLGAAAGDILKVYVRRREDGDFLRSTLRERVGDTVPLIFLRGDICRSELLLEIDGFHRG